MKTRAAWQLGQDIDSIEEVVEGTLINGDRGGAIRGRVREPERTLVQALVEDAEAGAIEEEHLDGLTPLAEEDEQGAAARLTRDALRGDAGETVEAPTEVDGLKADEDVDTTGDQGELRRRTSTTAARVA